MASNDPPRFLLLLPPPSGSDAASLKASYAETISQVLREVATHSSESSKAAVLEIALACPYLIGKRKALRSLLYDKTQSLLANFYRLVCVVAAKDNVDVEDADGVDVRILLLSWDIETQNDGQEDSEYGPIVTLRTLAKSERDWQYAFGVESTAGEAMVKAFVAAKGSGEPVTTVRSDEVTASDTSPAASYTHEQSTSSTQATHVKGQRHPHVILGGTFDHIHIGHKLLLTMLMFAVDEDNNERTATIGITGDEMLKNKKHAEVLESWEDRYRAVITFLNALVDFAPPSSSGQRRVVVRDDPVPNGKSIDLYYPNGLAVKCTEIQDAYGPTITEERLTALIVSGETRAGGKAVNDKRVEKGWHPLEVFEVDVLDAEDDGDDAKVKEGFDSKLSSTSIREKLAKKRQSSL